MSNDPQSPRSDTARHRQDSADPESGADSPPAKGAAIPTAPVVRATGDVPQERPCLRCGTRFQSEGFGERICGRCKGSSTWRSAAPSTRASGRRR